MFHTSEYIAIHPRHAYGHNHTGHSGAPQTITVKTDRDNQNATRQGKVYSELRTMIKRQLSAGAYSVMTWLYMIMKREY